MQSRRWFFIASAVAAGVVVATFTYERWTVYRVQHALSVLFEQTPPFFQQNPQGSSSSTTAGEIIERQRQLQRARRAETRTGRDLERRCMEWRRHVGAQGGAYAREEMQRACDRYERYLDGF